MSVDLSAINESQRGRNKRGQQSGQEPFQMPIGGFGGIEPPKGEKMFVILKLVHKRKGRVYIDGICDNVENPTTKKRERIWLLNGVSSIWTSELTEQLKDKDFVKHNRRSLMFEDGVCRIPVHDDNAIAFAKVNVNNVGKRRNGAGKWDYFEYDPQEEAKENAKREDKEIEMILKARELKVEPMKKLAAFFGVRFIDDLGMAIGDEGVRSELIRISKRDPYTFEKYLDSDEVNISWLVKRAIMEAKIDLTGQQGNAIWAGGKGFIAKIPADRKHYEYLTELAMTNSEEGKTFKQQLQTLIT